MKTMTLDEYRKALQEQGVPREHLAFRCPMCGTIQSATDFFKAGAATSMDDVEKWIGFSCVGRFTDAGPHKKGEAPGKGCNWTLGGLFKVHTVEIEHEGKRCPSFEIATPEEAQEHLRRNTAEVAA